MRQLVSKVGGGEIGATIIARTMYATIKAAKLQTNFILIPRRLTLAQYTTDHSTQPTYSVA